MRRGNLMLGAAAVALACVLAAPAVAMATEGGRNMYRLYNPYSTEHLFTTNKDEYDLLGREGWRQEGVAWQVPASGDPVYRLYNPFSGDHHYTMRMDEYVSLGKVGWRQEGLSFYSASSDDGIAVYRLFNPYETVGTHHYTTEEDEYVSLGKVGWRQEGVAWYGLASSGQDPDTTPDTTLPASMTSAIDFFNYVDDAEGDAHGAAALTLIDINNPAGINSWLIQGTGTSMDGQPFPAYTHDGSPTDATYIGNMYVALDIIDECNRLRALEGVPALKVTDVGMAIGMLNANWSGAYLDLTGQLAHAANHGEGYNWAENVAYGYASAKDSFVGWYWEEKATYLGQPVTDPDTGVTYQPVPGGQTGHYLNIIDPSYAVTGAGFMRTSSGAPVFAQDFKPQNTVPRPGLFGDYFESGVTDELYTVDEYRARLDAAVRAYS